MRRPAPAIRAAAPTLDCADASAAPLCPSQCKLERNYRSSAAIVAAANALVAHNAQRKPKSVFTSNAAGERVAVVECRNVEAEAQFVVARARALLARSARPREIAVLYRTSRTVRPTPPDLA